MLLHVRPNLESCHVIDRHAKVVLAVYVLPAELNHVLAVAGNQTLCGRGYGMLSQFGAHGPQCLLVGLVP